MALSWGGEPVSPAQAQRALVALWHCADTRCALCAECLQILRVALGLTDQEPSPVPEIPPDDPIRQFKPDVRKTRPPPRPRTRR